MSSSRCIGALLLAILPSASAYALHPACTHPVLRSRTAAVSMIDDESYRLAMEQQAAASRAAYEAQVAEEKVQKAASSSDARFNGEASAAALRAAYEKKTGTGAVVADETPAVVNVPAKKKPAKFTLRFGAPQKKLSPAELEAKREKAAAVKAAAAAKAEAAAKARAEKAAAAKAEAARKAEAAKAARAQKAAAAAAAKNAKTVYSGKVVPTARPAAKPTAKRAAQSPTKTTGEQQETPAKAFMRVMAPIYMPPRMDKKDESTPKAKPTGRVVPTKAKKAAAAKPVRSSEETPAKAFMRVMGPVYMPPRMDKKDASKGRR